MRALLSSAINTYESTEDNFCCSTVDMACVCLVISFQAQQGAADEAMQLLKLILV
jgi:hypothetical protein